jgi:uncharacterized protein (TIGR03066 family)
MLVGLFAAGTLAAPVPKEKEAKKTTEQKLLGKWKLVDTSGDGGVDDTSSFYVVFKEKGELESVYETKGQPGKPTVYAGTYKVVDDEKIDFTVTELGQKRSEVLTITTLTDTEVSWVDADKVTEKFERVKEEK